MTGFFSSCWKKRLVVGVGISLVSTIGLFLLESFFRPLAKQGLYFQGWSSEVLMQTASIADLRDEPVKSLWYLHIQPPLFDFLRATFAKLVGTGDDLVTLWRVDACLILLWGLIYGLTIFVLFWWLSDLTEIKFSAVGAIIFSLHPAFIFYASHLDTTLLSTFFFLLFCYLIWRIKEKKNVSPFILAICFLLLFFTRSIFQWYWLLFLPVCLFLLQYPKRRIIVFLALTCSVVAIFSLKQMVLFGSTSTSSFSGMNLARSIGIPNVMDYYQSPPVPFQGKEPNLTSPRALSRVLKVQGTFNFNHRGYLEANRRLTEAYRKEIFQGPTDRLLEAFKINLSIYFQPSSHYTPHVIVDNLFWRDFYDQLFSYPLLPLLLLLAFLGWAKKTKGEDLLKTLGFVLPIFLVVTVCILFEQGENMRLKFFCEPMLFCFLFYSSTLAIDFFSKSSQDKKSTEDGSASDDLLASKE